jgi:hypothetical protein
MGNIWFTNPELDIWLRQLQADGIGKRSEIVNQALIEYKQRHFDGVFNTKAEAEAELRKVLFQIEELKATEKELSVKKKRLKDLINSSASNEKPKDSPSNERPQNVGQV